MAAPAEMTTADLSGTFIMNKDLSDPVDKILQLQGIGWFVRKAISLGTLALYVKHHKDDNGVEHIDIKQTVAGLKGTEESRTLDWNERVHKDYIWGDVISKARRVKVEEVEHEYLKMGWTPETIKSSVIHSHEVSDTVNSGKSWNAEQVWGFELINGEKRHVRRVRVSNEKEVIEARLIYNYIV